MKVEPIKNITKMRPVSIELTAEEAYRLMLVLGQTVPTNNPAWELYTRLSEIHLGEK